VGLTAMGAWPVIDADSHVTERADVWTSRVPRKYAELVPRVDLHPKTGHHHWRIGDHWFWPVTGGLLTQAGWHEYMPLGPWEYEDVDPAAFNAPDRLKKMDDYGIDIQILYPNIVGFIAGAMIPNGLEVSTMIVRAYNDFIHEWSSADPKRLVPMAMIPFWDLDAAVAEMERCVALGFKGVLFANKFERLGLPSFVDPHWDRVYAAAQDLDVPINYHVGFGSFDKEYEEDEGLLGGQRREASSPEERRGFALWPALISMAQNDLLGTILTSGLCERFPRLKLVNVETGFGHIPYYLESLDWHWKVWGNDNALPLLPSEYFKRQCYGTHWFERTTLRDLDLFPDNFMFSTDYPHGTSLAPGPCGGTELTPVEFVHEAYGSLDPELRTKALSGNAKTVYKLELDQA
jgi:predicted TIM-barrel fold metal-dependent hydrolase